MNRLVGLVHSSNEAAWPSTMLRIILNYLSIQQRRVDIVQRDGFLYHLAMPMRRYPNIAIGNLLSDPP